MSLIIFVVTGLSAGVYSLMEYYDSKESYHTLSKQTANSLSHMPSMGKALISGEIGEVEANVLRATHQAENPTITVMQSQWNNDRTPECNLNWELLFSRQDKPLFNVWSDSH